MMDRKIILVTSIVSVGCSALSFYLGYLYGKKKVYEKVTRDLEEQNEALLKIKGVLNGDDYDIPEDRVYAGDKNGMTLNDYFAHVMDSKEQVGDWIDTYLNGPVGDVEIISPAPEEDPHEEDILNDDPHVISEEEFNDEKYDIYDKVDLFYYSDDTLADESDEVIPNRADLIGDALYHFGEGSREEDIVHVRNDSLSCDFEIRKVNMTFTEYLGEDE